MDGLAIIIVAFILFLCIISWIIGIISLGFGYKQLLGNNARKGKKWFKIALNMDDKFPYGSTERAALLGLVLCHLSLGEDESALLQFDNEKAATAFTDIVYAIGRLKKILKSSNHTYGIDWRDAFK